MNADCIAPAEEFEQVFERSMPPLHPQVAALRAHLTSLDGLDPTDTTAAAERLDALRARVRRQLGFTASERLR